MKIKKGDMVVVITGKERNKTGKVLRVSKKTDRVVVEGLNKVVRHVKKTKTQAGSKNTFEAPLHVSNVMVLDPKTKKGTRIGYKVSKEGKKERIAKKSNSVI